MASKNIIYSQNLYQRSIFSEEEGKQWYKDLELSLIPIFKYLEASIKAEVDRSISAFFEIIPDEITIKLHPLQKKFSPITGCKIIVEFEDDWYEIINKDDLFESYPDFLESENWKLLYSEAQEFHEITKNDIRFEKINIENVEDEDLESHLFIRLPHKPQPDEIIMYKKANLDLKHIFQDLNRLIATTKDKILTITDRQRLENKLELIIEETLLEKKEFRIDGFPVKVCSIENINNLNNIKNVIDKVNDTEEKEIKFIRNYEKGYFIIPVGNYQNIIALDENRTPIQIKQISLEPVKYLENESNKRIILQEISESIYTSEFIPENDSIWSGNDDIKYRCQRIENDKKSIKIRLYDIDENKDDEEIARKTPVDYFFDDDVEEVMGEKDFNQAKRNKLLFKVHKHGGNQEDHSIRLKVNNSYNQTKKSLEYLIESKKPLYIHRNTYQLEVQKRFLEYLLQRPLPIYRPLLRLGVSKDKTQNEWEEVQFTDKIKEKEWYILKDKKIEGTESQRKFVHIAMNTPEFAFLEGPPGSGKTTTILELILQLHQRGKRILLAASTHVAVDNILELLKEKFPEKLPGIFPIRIGATWNISEKVEEFQIEQVLSDSFDQYDPESISDMDSLLLDCSNLVCGTMVGILQHPRFKNSFKNNVGTYPNFDVLIIDEASKTTFQEFIVPALFAKKWILVGDIKQLAPYAESTYLTRYFQNYTRDDNSLVISNELQLALFYKYIILNEYLIRQNYRNDYWCIPTDDAVLISLKKELKAFYNSEKITNYPKDKWPFILFISNTSRNQSEEAFFEINKNELIGDNVNSLIVHTADVIFIETKLLQDFHDRIPSKFLVVGRKSWEFTSQYYRYQKFESNSNQKKISLYVSNPILKNLAEINTFLAEKSWASELSWRIIRMFELREIEYSSQRYKKTVDLLNPSSEDIYNMIRDAWSAALPSILETLQVGLSGIQNHTLNSPIKTGLKELLTPRHVVLEYQMRMHPEISHFSRDCFYNGIALKDSILINREWSYEPYPGKPYKTRFTWIDCVDNNQKHKTKNFTEAKIIENELKRFIHWATTDKKAKKTTWSVAIITYYNAQRLIFEKFLQDYTKLSQHHSSFTKDNVMIYLNTVDKIQGREADIVFLSMVRNFKNGRPVLGFMDSPNRLNVACTRAKFQLVIVGQIENFNNHNFSDFTAKLTEITSKEGEYIARSKSNKDSEINKENIKKIPSNKTKLSLPIERNRKSKTENQNNQNQNGNEDFDNCPKCGKRKRKRFRQCLDCEQKERKLKGLVLCPQCKKRYYDPKKFQTCLKCFKQTGGNR